MKEREMYYYIQNGENFEKWLISFDEEELIKLRDEMIENCSLIIPDEKNEFSKNPSSCKLSNCEYRNVKDLGYTRTKDNGILPDTIYHMYIYTKYCYPDAVLSINKILDGDIQELSHIEFKPKRNYDEYIKEESKKIDSISNLEVTKKVAALNEFQKIIEESKATKCQKGTDEYKEKFEKIFTKKLIKIIKVADIMELFDFLGRDSRELDLTPDISGKSLEYNPRKRVKK